MLLGVTGHAYLALGCFGEIALFDDADPLLADTAEVAVLVQDQTEEGPEACHLVGELPCSS